MDCTRLHVPITEHVQTRAMHLFFPETDLANVCKCIYHQNIRALDSIY